MRELFEICPKIQFFNFFGVFLALRAVNLIGKDVKYCVLMCQGQPGKIICLSPEKMTIFPHLAYFPPVPPKKLALPPTLKLYF